MSKKRRLVTVAAFNSPVEADLARSRLTEAGIPASLADETTAGNFWVLVNAVGGVKLQVWEDDLARARETLGIDAESGSGPDPAAASATAGQGWTCPRCATHVEPGFEVCWNCGSAADGSVDPDFVAEASDDAPEAPAPRSDPEAAHGEADFEDEADAAPDDNPFRSPRAPLVDDAIVPEEPPPELTEHGDDLARRALWAAVVSMVICPVIFNVISIGMLLSLAVRNDPLSRRGSRRYYAAWLVNIVAVWVLFIVYIPISGVLVSLRRVFHGI